MIRLDNVSKSYRLGMGLVHALRDVSLTIEAGEFVAIMGSSGSGKSTLMNLAGCLDHPTSGDIWIDDRDVIHMDDAQLSALRNEKIGFVFQSFELLSRLTALKNVELPFLYARTRPQSVRLAAMSALERVGLADRIHHRPSELSGGQRQRVAIARAIVRDPPILLADEPTGNLDSETTGEIMDIFQSLNESGQTVVIVTHEDAIAARCDRVLTLSDGRLVKDRSSAPPPAREHERAIADGMGP